VPGIGVRTTDGVEYRGEPQATTRPSPASLRKKGPCPTRPE